MKFIQVFCCVILFFFLSIIAPLEISAQYAYVTNDSSISIINTLTNTVELTVPVINDVYNDIELTPDGKFAYLAGFWGHQVVVFNTTTNMVETIIPIPIGNPHGIAITPDGNTVYVTCFWSSAIIVIDINTNTIVDQIDVPGWWSVYGITLSPDGNTAYVTSRYSASITVLDLKSKSVTATISVGSEPLEVALTPDGNFAYVPNSYSDNVSVINTNSNSVVATIPVGHHPCNATFSPDGSKVYVPNQFGSSVSIINTSTNSVSAVVPVGNGPVDVGFTGNGLYAYTTNELSNFVSVINTNLNSVIATIPVRNNPTFIVIPVSAPPTAITHAASKINFSSGMLNAIVNPQNSESSVYFEWGQDNTLANFNSTSPQLISAGASDVEVSTDLQGLKANTTYYFRVVGENIFGTAKGDILSFNTLTIQQGIELIMEMVSEDLLTGKLGGGCRNALIKKLNAAIEQINKNKYHTAINQLNAFINHLSALLKTGKIDVADGNLIVNLATEVIEQLSGMDKLSSDNFLVPSDYELVQNYPNPFNPATQIRFGIPQIGNVTLRIFNTNGQLVKTLVNGVMTEGTYEIQWNADDDNGMKVASGIYFCRLTVNNSNINFSKVNKMILLK